jgi:hypothetical protein
MNMSSNLPKDLCFSGVWGISFPKKTVVTCHFQLLYLVEKTFLEKWLHLEHAVSIMPNSSSEYE